MTLAEIKTYTTGMFGITDAAALAKAEEFAKARYRMIWDQQYWRQTRYQETIAVTSGSQDITIGANCEFVIAARWADSYELLPINDLAAIALNPAGYDQRGAVAAFTPLGKDTSGNAVIRLQQKANESKNLLVIGKRKCLELSASSDSPTIPGASQALCNYVMADLYAWIRRGSMSDMFLARGDQDLAKMVEIETAQTSDIRRIIPTEQLLDDDRSSTSFMG